MGMARPKNLTENYRLRPRKDGIFEVAWTDLKTGKARRVSTGTKDQQTARVRFSQIVADSQKVMPPDTVTLEWVVGQYLVEKEATKTPRQYLSIKTSLAPILKRLGNLRPDQISQTTIDGYPNLGKIWVKNLREAVKNVLGASARSAKKGDAVNVINEDDFLPRCGYVIKQLQEANKPHPILFERGSSVVKVTNDSGVSIKDLNFNEFSAELNLATPFRERIGTGDSDAPKTKATQTACTLSGLFPCNLHGNPPFESVTCLWPSRLPASNY